MNFFLGKKETLFVNEFGILEPAKSQSKVPDVILIPMIAFDKDKYRLGYGKDFMTAILTNI